MVVSNSANSKLFWSYASEIIIGIAQPLLLLALTDKIDVNAYGIFSFLTVLLTLSKALMDASSKYIIVVSEERKFYALGSVIFSNLLFACGIFLIFLLFGTRLLDYFNIKVSYVLFLAFISQVYLFAISMPIQMFYIRELEYKEIFFYRIVFSLGPQATAIGLLYLSFGSMDAMVYGYLVGTVVSTILLTLKFVLTEKIVFRGSLIFNKPYFNFTMLNFMDLVGVGIFSSLDVFLVIKFLGAESSGVYKLSNSLGMLVSSFLIVPLTNLLFPLFTKNQRNGISNIQLFVDIWKLIFIINFLIIIILILSKSLPYDIVGFDLWKWKFLDDYVVLICIYNLIGWLTQPFSEYYKSIGLTKINVFFMFGQLIVLFPLYYYSVTYGLYGLIYSKIIFAFVALITHFLLSRSIIKLPSISMLVFALRYLIYGFLVFLVSAKLVKDDLNVIVPFIAFILLVFMVYVFDRDFIREMTLRLIKGKRK